MNELFEFEGRMYKAVPLKAGEFHCDNCSFHEYRECEYEPDIPDCNADKRDDRNDVYFVEVKTNFDRITVDQRTLAEQLVYSVWDEFNGYRWTSTVIQCAYKRRGDAVSATLEWLGKEVEK